MAKPLGTWKMFDNPIDNHTDIEVPLYDKLRFHEAKKVGLIDDYFISNHYHQSINSIDAFATLFHLITTSIGQGISLNWQYAIF